MTKAQKLAWLRGHEYEVCRVEGCDQTTWQAWDTLDYDGYRIVALTQKEAIEEAYRFLSEQVNYIKH